MTKHILYRSLCAGALLCGATAAQAAPTVVNGGFESGDFSGWSLIEDQGYNAVDTGSQHSGDYSAFFGETGAPASIAQTLATETGHTYAVTFWLSNLGGSVNNTSTQNTFQMLIDGGALVSINDKSATGYTEYQLDFKAASAATNLAFSFHHDETFWLLDDVSIRDVTSPVPEPSTVVMMLLGLGALALRLQRRS